MNAALYTRPASMEPLLPVASQPEIAELTCEILRRSGHLAGQMPALINRQRIASLVREMNSYYSNLIEGHKTLPRDIEAALRQDYSSDETKRTNQHLARAHVQVETLMRERLAAEPALSIHSPEFLRWIHRELYRFLPDDLRNGKDESGGIYPVEPGALRTFEVKVGAHQPPFHGCLPDFLERFSGFYHQPDIPPTSQLAALAAAHHRLTWIHPFADGNGRVARLYSQAWLIRCQVDGGGLWTLSRGLARQRRSYYAALASADRRRSHDYDGRGNLTDKGLAEFCLFLLGAMLDQLNFMSRLLELPMLAARLERHLQSGLPRVGTRQRERLGRLLKAALFEGEIARGRVGEIVGLGGTAAREIIRLAVGEGWLGSNTEKTALSLVFSSRNLEIYFPQLYQDLALEESV